MVITIVVSCVYSEGQSDHCDGHYSVLYDGQPQWSLWWSVVVFSMKVSHSSHSGSVLVVIVMVSHNGHYSGQL